MSFWSSLNPFKLFKLPKPPRLQPASVQAPTSSDEGTPIGVLWGTRPLKSNNYTYFGDVKQVAIKEKTGKK